MHTTVALNDDTIMAAAAEHGITDQSELLQHLGLLGLEPVTVAVIAQIHCRLRIPIRKIARVTAWPVENARDLATG